MCGDSLSSARKGTILITSGSKINVSFTRHVQAFGQLSAHFTLKYLSFHRGVCDVNNDVECSQKGVGNICVPKDIVCARKVEVCNSFNISTCSQNPEDKKSLEYLKYILCALLGIFMLFGIKFFYRQYRKGRSNENCISKLKQRFVRDDQDNSNELAVFSAMDNYSALRESVPNIFYNSGRENNIVDTPVCTDNNATTQNIFSPYPSAPTLEEMGYESPASLEREVFASLEHESPASLERELPASPPPTYDESVVPSYTEVMTHKDKYIVH